MKNIIFDWSGVVKDALNSQVWLINKIFQKHGRQPISLEEFRDNWVQPYDLFYKKYLPDISLEEESRDYLEAIMSPECPKSPSCIGITQLIKKLKGEGCFLSIVSSDFPETILLEIKQYGLDGIFDEVVMDVNDKTSSVESLIAKYKLDLSKTYFIGDSNHEIEVSRKVGIKSIAVTWGLCSPKVLKACIPDFLVNEVTDLEKILLQR